MHHKHKKGEYVNSTEDKVVRDFPTILIPGLDGTMELKLSGRPVVMPHGYGTPKSSARVGNEPPCCNMAAAEYRNRSKLSLGILV